MSNAAIESYMAYEAQDTDDWVETVDLALRDVQEIKQRGAGETRLEFAHTVRRAALELFVADHETSELPVGSAARNAAYAAVKLANLLMAGAPPAILEHEVQALYRLVARAANAAS